MSMRSASPHLIRVVVRNARFREQKFEPDFDLWSADVVLNDVLYGGVLFAETDTMVWIYELNLSLSALTKMLPGQARFISAVRSITRERYVHVGPFAAALFTGNNYSCELKVTEAYLDARGIDCESGIALDPDDPLGEPP